MDEATQALARLDDAALSELEERARQLLVLCAGALALPEVAARHRVFAGLVKATAESLGVLERVHTGGYGKHVPGASTQVAHGVRPRELRSEAISGTMVSVRTTLGDLGTPWGR